MSMANVNMLQEKKFAQKEILKASKDLSSAKMRLEGTQYESKINKIWELLYQVNNDLIAEIRNK